MPDSTGVRTMDASFHALLEADTNATFISDALRVDAPLTARPFTRTCREIYISKVSRFGSRTTLEKMLAGGRARRRFPQRG